LNTENTEPTLPTTLKHPGGGREEGLFLFLTLVDILPPPAPPTPLTLTSPPLLSYFLNSQAHITVVSRLRKEDNKDDI